MTTFITLWLYLWGALDVWLAMPKRDRGLQLFAIAVMWPIMAPIGLAMQAYYDT